MNTKILLIVTVLSFQCSFVFSQCVSVELSVTWEKGYDLFKKDSLVSIPKLHITYRNMSNTNYYFLKISDSKNGLPVFPHGSLLHSSDPEEYLRRRHNYLKKAMSHSNYAKQEFYVKIGDEPVFSPGWFVHHDTLNMNKEYEIEFINDDLANIYEYMCRTNNSECSVKKLYFSPSDVTRESISDTVKDQFVFLKPDEVYVDTYNLIGFKLVEGCFTFMVNQYRFKDHVLTDPVWDNDKAYWMEQKEDLPAKAGEYHLYSGLFFTNTVTVDFLEYVRY